MPVRNLLALAVLVLLSGLASAQSPKALKIGVATSGGTTLPALVISQQKLDEKYGLRIEWVRLDQAALQKAFASGR